MTTRLSELPGYDKIVALKVITRSFEKFVRIIYLPVCLIILFNKFHSVSEWNNVSLTTSAVLVRICYYFTLSAICIKRDVKEMRSFYCCTIEKKGQVGFHWFSAAPKGSRVKRRRMWAALFFFLPTSESWKYQRKRLRAAWHFGYFTVETVHTANGLLLSVVCFWWIRNKLWIKCGLLTAAPGHFFFFFCRWFIFQVLARDFGVFEIVCWVHLCNYFWGRLHDM